MRLKELVAISIVGCSKIAGGCTSPNPEYTKQEAPPVCFVPDVHSDTITEEMVENTRQKCFAAAVEIAVMGGALMVQAGADKEMMLDVFKRMTDKKEAECLALHGLDNL